MEDTITLHLCYNNGRNAFIQMST